MKIKTIIILLLSGVILASCKKNRESDFDPIEITGEVQDASEFGLNNGAIDITISGGAKPFTYKWSTRAETEDLSGIGAGIYWVQVRDFYSDTATDTFMVSQPGPDTLKIAFDFNNPSTTNSNDGQISVLTSGGYPPFQYVWSNSNTSNTIQNLAAGKYVVTVSDSRGQVVSDSLILSDFIEDIEGNRYQTVKIGEQIWMRENLRVQSAPDGSPISSFAYEKDTTNVTSYGRLYTWDIAMNGSTAENSQGICPDGWHIPSDSEFKALEMHLGMSEAEANLGNTWRGEGVGTALKAGGNSGFDAVLAGRLAPSGTFSVAGRMEYLWTSTESGAENAWRRCLDKYATNVGRWDTFPKSYGFSVRCIKND